jgi:hypothetical protein
MDKDELVHEIGKMLLEDEKIRSRRPWQSLAMVAQITPGSTKVNGFVYRGGGAAVPTSPGNFDVMDKFEELREAMREPGKEPWKAALVRIDDASRRISIDFEYDHPEKWLIVPSTVKQMAEALRPAE